MSAVFAFPTLTVTLTDAYQTIGTSTLARGKAARLTKRQESDTADFTLRYREAIAILASHNRYL